MYVCIEGDLSDPRRRQQWLHVIDASCLHVRVHEQHEPRLCLVDGDHLVRKEARLGPDFEAEVALVVDYIVKEQVEGGPLSRRFGGVSLDGLA